MHITELIWVVRFRVRAVGNWDAKEVAKRTPPISQLVLQELRGTNAVPDSLIVVQVCLTTAATTVTVAEDLEDQIGHYEIRTSLVIVDISEDAHYFAIHVGEDGLVHGSKPRIHVSRRQDDFGTGIRFEEIIPKEGPG